MAMRSVLSRAGALTRSMEATRGATRYFSDGKGCRVLGEEERAAENIYIQKMEREKLEKQKKRPIRKRRALRRILAIEADMETVENSLL